MSDLRPRASRRTPSVARHGRLKHTHPLATLVKVLVSVVAVCLVSGTSLVAFATWDLKQGMKPTIHLIGQTPKPKQPAAPIAQLGPLPGAFNVLVTATDTRTDQGDGWGSVADSSGAGLNDATMLLHVAADHTTATVISFPRDLMIPIPSCPDGNGGWNSARSKQALNTTLMDGGLSCTVLTVSNLINEENFPIPYAGIVEFNGVVAMSNAIGGVQVCVANGIYDPQNRAINLTPGMHTLKGKQAAEFLRIRHGLGDDGDLSRISNQQVFLSALLRQVRQKSTLSNPAKVWGLAKAVGDYVHLSDTLDLNTLYQMAMAVNNLDLSKVLFVQYPVLTDPDNPNRVVPDSASATALFDALASDQPIALGGSTGDGAVLATPTHGATDLTAPATDPAPQTDAPDAGSNGAPGGSGLVLPENISGQAAATQTCSKGQG